MSSSDTGRRNLYLILLGLTLAGVLLLWRCDSSEGPAPLRAEPATLEDQTEPPAEKRELSEFERRAPVRRPPPPPEPPPDEDEETLEEKRTHIRLFGSAKVEAYYAKTSQIQGVRVSRIQPGSFWAMLGARNGDLVIEVNGQLIDDPEIANTLMNELSASPYILLRVRGADGDERTLEYPDRG